MSINIVEIEKALRDQLEVDVGVQSFMNGRGILIGEYVNNDPNNAPWMCVYKGKSRYDSRTLGPSAANWEVFPEVKVAVQSVNVASGEICEEELEERVRLIIDGIFLDRTIRNTVDMITNVEVEYLYNEVDRESVYFQTAIITVSLEVMNR